MVREAAQLLAVSSPPASEDGLLLLRSLAAAELLANRPNILDIWQNYLKLQPKQDHERIAHRLATEVHHASEVLDVPRQTKYFASATDRIRAMAVYVANCLCLASRLTSVGLQVTIPLFLGEPDAALALERWRRLMRLLAAGLTKTDATAFHRSITLKQSEGGLVLAQAGPADVEFASLTGWERLTSDLRGEMLHRAGFVLYSSWHPRTREEIALVELVTAPERKPLDDLRRDLLAACSNALTGAFDVDPQIRDAVTGLLLECAQRLPYTNTCLATAALVEESAGGQVNWNPITRALKRAEETNNRFELRPTDEDVVQLQLLTPAGRVALPGRLRHLTSQSDCPDTVRRAFDFLHSCTSLL
jgi:hypothetical protein